MAEQMMQGKAGEMVAIQTIPVGYKQTEVGVIPEDWDVVSVSSLISSIGSGVSVNSVDKINAFSHGMHVLKTSCVSEGGFLPDEKKSILPSDIHRAKCSPAKGDIIVSRMNTPMLVGELGYVSVDIEDSFLPDRLWLMKFKNSEDIDSRWLSWLLSSSTFSKKIKESATGTSGSMKNISKDTFLAMLVPKPVFKEQEIIATTLADTDSLIAGLEQLIAKRQAIKTATMQQLMTGRIRLPQFAQRPDGTPKGYKFSEMGQIPEDWEVYLIGKVCDLLTGYPFPSNKYSDSGVRLLRGSNVKRGVTDWSAEITQYWPSISQEIKQYELLVGDVVISMDGSLVGRSFAQLTEVDLPAVLLQRVARIRSAQVSQDFLKEWVCSPFFTEHCDSVKTVTAIPHISPQDIRDFKFLLPPTMHEQTAIATILSDMDSELAVLEQKLAKARDVKQGMMQQLLTGRIRLPLPQEA
ncbi:restriction endonuclease subunit S [Aeromonas salmonicida]|uniref:restriction endonuclease subunit S n=1 Tax=Aeromonas salmonicida TaxID=645 RepID=UPI003D2487B5